MSRKRSPSLRAQAFKGWIDGRGLSALRVSKQAGVPYTTLASFVQGDTQSLKGENETKIAEALGATVDEIFAGAEAAARPIPVISMVAAGKLADPDTQIEDGAQTIEISGLSPGDYFATRVAGDSMDRLSPNGSLILVNRGERELIRGRRYIFGRRGETTYKRYEPDPMRLVPESTNPSHEPIFPRSEEEWTVIGRVRLTLMDDL